MVDGQAVVMDDAADDTRSASLSLPRPRTVLIGGIVGLTCGVEELRLRGGSFSRRLLLARTAIGCAAAAVHSACEPAARRAVARASAQTCVRAEWAASVLVGGGVLGAGALLARRAGARPLMALPLLVIPSFYATLITRENLVMLRATRPVVADALAASSLAALPAGLLCWPPPLLALLLPALVLPPACRALDDDEHRHEPPAVAPDDDVRAACFLNPSPLASLPAARPLYALQQQRADDAPPPMVVVAAVAPATKAGAETAADDVDVTCSAAGGGSRLAAARDAARHAMARLLEARDASVTRGARALFDVIGAMDGRRVTVVEAAEAVVVVVPRDDDGADSAAAERACAAIAEAVRAAEDDGDDDSPAAHPWAVGGTAAVDLRELRAALDGALLEAQEAALRDARPPQPSLAQRAAEWAAVPWRPSWRGGGGGDVGGGGGGGDGGAAASLAGLLELRGGATAALSAAARADALRRLGWLRETLGPVVESRVANRLPLVEGEAVRAAARGFESWVLPPDVVGNDECCEGLVFVAADARNNLLWTRPVGWFRWFASGDLCLLALLLALKELA